MKQLIAFLEMRILSCENEAEEYIQELDNQAGADKELAKAEAFQEVLNWINENKNDNQN